MLFPLWEAAIAAGATLKELQEVDTYPIKFQARLIAWHRMHGLVRIHEQDAAMKQVKK